MNEVECRFDDGAIVPATFSLSLEKETIRKKAVADGTFMKAPNGKDTNLTEDQWLSVRTEAFKNWFGDWEKDPQNASKVVDENGEPRVVYHGTYGDFTVFDKAMIGSATDYGLWGRGFYFTNMENTPYGNKKLALFLNFRNPFIFNDYKSAEEIGDYLNIWDGNFHEDDRFGIFRPYARGAAQIAGSAQERGHDGLIAVMGKWTEYIAFEPNQIKSATDNRGTFDPKNPDITFSVIGPNAATWGKYADKAFAGRDDGKLRAEIDASKAGVRCGVLQKDKPVKLGELLDFAELYEAYPDAKDITVVLEDKTVKDAGGYFSPWRNAIHLFTNRTKGADSLKSGLLHEVQHWIQHEEGFINGISPSSARAGMFSALIKKGYLGDRLRWINTPEFARDELERIARLMRRPAAIKKMGEKYEVQEVMDVGIMAQQAIELLAKNYRLRQLSDAADFRTRNRGNSPSLSCLKNSC